MIYGMMRIKDEARWITKVIESLLPCIEKIFILDDHSTDDTAAICESFEKVTLIQSPFEGLDEARDKNYLLEQIEKIAKRGDWIICIDGDEELAAGSEQEINKIASQSMDCAYRFNVLYLWNNPSQIRVDGVFGRCSRPSMFSLIPGRRFSSQNGGGLHCGNVPEMQNVRPSNVRLLHYGWMERDDRIRKYNWYLAPDKQPIPPIEDGYRHAIIGDLLPAETVTRWGGPLELRSL